MEPLAFADVVPIAAAAVMLAVTMGLGGPRGACNALAWGLALRLLQIGLRAADYGIFARTEDSDRFAKGSRSIAEGGAGIYFRGGSERWENLLAMGRRHLGFSVVGLEVTAVLIWVVAGWLVLATIRRVTTDARAERVMWLVALLPAGLLWTSGLLRESSEFAFAALAAYIFVRLSASVDANLHPRWPVVASASVLALGGLLHEALFYGAIAFVLGSEMLRIVMDADGRLRPVELTLVVCALVAAALVFAGTIDSLLGTHESRVDFAGEASYAVAPPPLGPLTTVVDMVLRYALYLLAPLPWTMRGPFDLIGFADVALRVVLLIVAWRQRQNATVAAMLLMAVGIQFCFSLGTLNWGTAMRHHYVSLAPLAVAYAVAVGCAHRSRADSRRSSPTRSPLRMVNA
jgi:hypothetical protein